jgi:hypothetical protein
MRGDHGSGPDHSGQLERFSQKMFIKGNGCSLYLPSEGTLLGK